MTKQDIREELKIMEAERIRERELKIQEDPMAMSLLVAYAQSLQQTRCTKKKESDEEDQDPATNQKAS
ncbi:hypothetical protein [Acetobacterium wieringae]|uniref:hypothetical protein n=1 Tax=Acetobacterium wieringae TaxID=52694 RepID=UPI0031589EEA